MRHSHLKLLLVKVLAVFGISAAGAAPAMAFGGCVDSPENPTLLLALLGGAAAGVPWLRRYLKARHEKHNHTAVEGN